MLKKSLCALVSSAIFLSACASSPDHVPAAYVSPISYDNLTCEQIREEAQRLNVRVAELTGQQASDQGRDIMAASVAVVIFLPAVLFIRGDRQTAAQLSQVKGEIEAIKIANQKKNCGIVFQEEAKPAAAAPQSAIPGQP